ncbi:MAG: hypothetical protein AAB015_02305, partial [Nitrospirota bacterium]
DIDNGISAKYNARFGVVAVNIGFVTIEQVIEALTEQVMDNFSDRSHRLIGEIFLEKGWMTPEQIDMVLTELSKIKKKIGD